MAQSGKLQYLAGQASFEAAEPQEAIAAWKGKDSQVPCKIKGLHLSRSVSSLRSTAVCSASWALASAVSARALAAARLTLILARLVRWRTKIRLASRHPPQINAIPPRFPLRPLTLRAIPATLHCAGILDVKGL